MSSFKATLEATVLTILLALPVPLAFYGASALFIHETSSSFVFSLGTAFFYLARVAGPFEGLRQLLRPNVACSKCISTARPSSRGRSKRSSSGRRLRSCLPLFIALVLASAGLRLTSPEELQAYNNSLGRISFIIAMAALAATVMGIFRPRLRDGRFHRGFVRLSLSASAIITIVAIVPAALAVLGYYMTAVYISYLSLRTLWLIVGLVVLEGILWRWRTLTIRRARAEALEGAEVDLDVTEVQTKHFFRFVLVALGAVGLYTIWSGAIPALHMLERVQLLPTIAMIEPEDPTALTTAPPPTQAPAVEDVAGAPASDGTAAAAVEEEPASRLTAWDLLVAIFVIIVTVALVRDVPGIVELVLTRRTRIDSGARVAASTLVRYVILFGGLISVSKHLGLSWSSVQWLAAALTFGLGFGLQEVVANFVSGLILLIERPIRVGDAVTVGNLSGRITRIEIRATTITLWDRSEMIVPNKEFITGKLVNWTLSDSKRRIEIPLRVQYGADVAKVKSLLLEIAQSHPAVLDEPKPQVLLLEFTDDALKFELWIYLEFRQGIKTKDDLLVEIDKKFREHGIELGGPSLSLKVPDGASSPPKRLETPVRSATP